MAKVVMPEAGYAAAVNGLREKLQEAEKSGSPADIEQMLTNSMQNFLDENTPADFQARVVSHRASRRIVVTAMSGSSVKEFRRK